MTCDAHVSRPPPVLRKHSCSVGLKLKEVHCGCAISHAISHPCTPTGSTEPAPPCEDNCYYYYYTPIQATVGLGASHDPTLHPARHKSYHNMLFLPEGKVRPADKLQLQALPQSYPLLDSPDPSKPQSTVGTVLSIDTAPCQPGHMNSATLHPSEFDRKTLPNLLKSAQHL